MPNFVQVLHATIIPSRPLGGTLKHSRSVLHLSFFNAKGLKNAKTLVASVSWREVWVLASPAGVKRLCVLALTAAGVRSASAGDTTPKISTFSLSTLGGEGSVAGDWNGGKEGWVQSAASRKVMVLKIIHQVGHDTKRQMLKKCKLVSMPSTSCCNRPWYWRDPYPSQNGATR